MKLETEVLIILSGHQFLVLGFGTVLKENLKWISNVIVESLGIWITEVQKSQWGTLHHHASLCYLLLFSGCQSTSDW